MGLVSAGGRIAFVHIPKTGGWTVKHYLANEIDHLDLEGTALQKHVEAQGFPIGHVCLADFQRFIGRTPQSFDMVIAVLRDPYERELSQWQFWRDRYARGGRHLHDIVAAQYSTLDLFLLDPRSDFHKWYQQFHGDHTGVCGWTEHYGGFYRRWLEVDGRIPHNVVLLKAETMDAELPKLLQPYADHELPIPGRDNVGVQRAGNTRDYFSKLAANLVHEKYEWTWREGHYRQWSQDEVAKLREFKIQ